MLGLVREDYLTETSEEKLKRLEKRIEELDQDEVKPEVKQICEALTEMSIGIRELKVDIENNRLRNDQAVRVLTTVTRQVRKEVLKLIEGQQKEDARRLNWAIRSFYKNPLVVHPFYAFHTWK